jgi:hypothetical protein
MFVKSLNYIEALLRHQLVTAIGKEVKWDDLYHFVRYHNAKMLSPAPRSFCFAIRCPQHFPEGVLSIENGGNKHEPIETHVREVKSLPPLKIPLNAAATLELTGRLFFMVG